MRVSMGVATLLHLAALGVFIGGPGWVLYRVWLRHLGLSWRVAVGLVLAILSVLFSDLASLFGYSSRLMLAACGVVALGILIWWMLTRWKSAKNERATPQNTTLQDILFHLLLFGIFLAPAFVLYLPLDTDAQGFGYIALMIREGGTVNTFAPWQPDARYLYSPASFIWWAFLSDLFALPLHQVMLPFTHIIAGITVWLCIDLGQALMPGRPRARWLIPLMVTGGLSYFLTLMDSAYTSVKGVLFVVLFLILTFHAIRENDSRLAFLASVALAAVVLTHPDTIIILLIGYIPFYATFWLGRSQHRTRRVWLWMFVFIPAIGVVLTAPWLGRAWLLFFEASINSPVGVAFDPPGFVLLPKLLQYHGAVVPVLALLGAVIAVRRRWLVDMLMLTWLILLIDFSLFGALATLANKANINLMRYVYPHSVAWHGPIIAYAYLASLTVDHMLDRHPITLSRRFVSGLLGAGLGLITLSVILQYPLLRFSRSFLSINGAFSSRADMAAMDYLRENTPEDALILNYPEGFEAHWVPVIAERESVEFRGLLRIESQFISGLETYAKRQQALRDIYFNPPQVGAHEILLRYGITHIIIPQIVTEPAIFGDMGVIMRWRWPEETWYPLISSPADVDWLELVFEQDGAQVYRVLPAD